MTIQRISIAGNAWSVHDVGDGPTILLVHGFPLDHSMWTEQLNGLASHFRLIAPDLRGFGQSQSTSGTVTMAQFADDLAALLDALRIELPVTYMGFSMGGYIGWEFLLRHRAQLDRVIMADTRAIADTPEIARGRELMATRVEQEGASPVADSMLPRLFAKETLSTNPAIVESTRRVMLDTEPTGIAAALRGMAQRSDMQSHLAEMDLPILFLCGEHDEISPAAEMQELAVRVPHGQFQLIRNAGHMAPLENGPATNTAILAFLADS